MPSLTAYYHRDAATLLCHKGADREGRTIVLPDAAVRALRRAGPALLDALYPPRCVACGDDEAWLCAACLRRSPVLEPPWCLACGKPGARDRCDACRARPLALDRLRAACSFDGPIQTAVHAFKYQSLTVLAPVLGALMAAAWRRHGSPVDVVVPVPLHPSRERARGYNQAAILARQVGTSLGLPVEPRTLRRARATREQVRLTEQQRWANVWGAFAARTGRRGEPDGAIIGRRVLLVDDVCTTGATLDACARALLASRAATVSGLVLGRR